MSKQSPIKQKSKYKFYISLLFLILKINIIINEESSGINEPYPNVLQLDDNHIFLANSAGMFFCDLNLNPFRFHEYYNKTIYDFENIKYKILISQFTEYGNIICLIENVFYFFKGNSDLIIMGDLPSEITQSSYLNLLTYKKDEDNNFHFIVTFMDATNKYINIYHYQVNETKYKIVSNNIYSPFYFDYPNIEINSQYFTCQILDTEKYGKVLTCCFQTFDNDLIVVQSFDVENDLAEIEEYYAKTPIDNLNMITSILSVDKKNILVCYSPNNYYGYCFTYNFDLNQIYNNNVLIEKCSNRFSTFKLNYFNQTNEYVFICDHDNKFTVIKMDDQFNLINPDEITTQNFIIQEHYNYNSLSLIYDSNEGKYGIIMDPQNNTIQVCFTNKFLITTDFTEHFASQLQKPEDFVESVQTKEITLKETNKYYVFTEDHKVLVKSDVGEKVVIDLMNNEDLFIKTNDNNPIDPSLYSFYIELNTLKGDLTVDIDGEEIKVEQNFYAANIDHFNYYPIFSDESYVFTFTYFLFLKNKTRASIGSNLAFYVCKENCTCDLDNYRCTGCLENFITYKEQYNCMNLDDLKGVVYDEGQKLYLDCFRMCKTCFKVGYSEYEMNCLTCFEEYGDYMDEDNSCHEKLCDNLFYKDKNTGMKTCINESSCPEDYPNLNTDTKQCECLIDTLSEQNTESPKDITNESNSEDSSKTITTLNIIIEETNKPSENNYKQISYEKVMNLLNELVGKENLDQVNKAYEILSDSIKNIDISSFKEDITISGKNITYQITTSENQKNTEHISNVSIIDLGECEKIIKRKISYEDDPIPLLILKIDVKKGEAKTTAVEYEIYNPYTNEKIDLSICANASISIFAPVNLNNKENSLYDDLKKEGYDLFDGNNSFYNDLCSPYTSLNGTDVSLADRKEYYYNKEIVLCEDNCKYIEVNTTTEKVVCKCSVKTEVNVDNNQEFNPQKLMEKFYKVDDYSNFKVIYCYKLVFDKKILKKNICFYIMLILFTFFLTSMIINIFSAMKKINEIIFTIFKTKFSDNIFKKITDNGRKKRKRNTKTKFKGDNKSKVITGNVVFPKKKIGNESSSMEEDSSIVPNNKNNIYTTNDIDIKKRKFLKKKRKKKKVMNDSLIISSTQKNINNKEILELKEKRNHQSNNNTIKLEEKDIKMDNIINKENNIKNEQNNNKNNKEDKQNVNNININIINNIMNKQNPPLKNKILPSNNSYNEEKSQTKGEYDKKMKKRKSKKLKKRTVIHEMPNCVSSNTSSAVNLNSNYVLGRNKLKKSSNLYSPKDKENLKEFEGKKNLDKINLKQNNIENINSNVIYIDEELNRMEYENALNNDKRTYCQYYWSLLKKKHMIVLTFVSNNDYNVFTLKFSLFLLSISLFFSINALFFRDSSMHTIFLEQGKYNLIYQIPKILYSTLISFIMTVFLKILSLSQNELIAIKKEIDQNKSKNLAEQSKNCLKIKLFSFFIFGILLLIFFWYYISAFAAVYTNTQLHLIKDTLISFGISMSYPFIINLLPGIFRLYALQNEKKDKECLYKFSQILALL